MYGMKNLSLFLYSSPLRFYEFYFAIKCLMFNSVYTVILAIFH